MTNSDPARLLKNLSNADFWQPIDVSATTEQDWIGLRNPLALNVKNLQMRVIRIFKDRIENVWKISAHASSLPETNLAIKFEDNDLYQYILICGKRVKVGTIFELQLLKAYKSTYFRQNRRISVGELGWHIRDLILPAEEVNVQKRRSSIAAIMETYAKLSPPDLKMAYLDFFHDHDSPVLKYIRLSGNGFVMTDARHPEADKTRELEFFSHRYTFVPLQEAVPEDSLRQELVAEYKRTGIACEAVFPICVAKKSGGWDPIAYIRCHFRDANHITDQLLQAMVSIADAIAVSIRNSNFERYPVKESVIDASLTGIKVQVRNPAVRKALSHVSSFRCSLFTGSEAHSIEVRLEKMQQITLDDVDFIGCRIADISKKSYTDEKTESRETGMKAYRAALSGIKPG